MRIVVISDMEAFGGAAIVASRLVSEWSEDHDVRRVVGTSFGSDAVDSYAVRRGLGMLNRLGMRDAEYSFKPYTTLRSRRLLRLLREFKPDMISVHDIHHYPLAGDIWLQLVRIAPVVWSLHNMWSFTGGCAFSLDCDLYRTGCMEPCPQKCCRPASDVSNVATRWTRQQAMLGQFSNAPLVGVCPSKWLEGCAVKGGWSRDRLRVIRQPVSGDVYAPMSRESAKEALLIPRDRKCIMFSAVSPGQDLRKGYRFLAEALRRLDRTSRPFCLVVGADAEARDRDRLTIAHTRSETFLRLCYAASDALVFPSLAESFGLVYAEAMAVGTPCIAFDNTACNEIVTDGVTGFVARNGDVDDLVRCVERLLNMPDSEMTQMQATCRRLARRDFDQRTQASRYVELFQELAAASKV